MSKPPKNHGKRWTLGRMQVHLGVGEVRQRAEMVQGHVRHHDVAHVGRVAQRNERLRGLMRDFYAAFRDRLAERVLRWQAEGKVAASAAPQDVAQTLLSLVLGFVVQSAVLRDADPAGHARGLAAIHAA